MNYAGLLIVAALILGGGTQQFLWTDGLLQALMIPAMLIGFFHLFDGRLYRSAKVLVICILLVLGLQFLPVATGASLPAPMTELETIKTWTLSPANSLQAALFAVTVLGFACFMATFNELDQQRLVRFLILGFAINFLVGVIQLSYSRETPITGLFPYPAKRGFFANENHFSTLVFMILPLLAWRFLAARNNWPVYLMISFLIVGFLFSVGSRAGMGISLILMILGWLWFAFGKEHGKLSLAALGTAGVLAVILLATLGDSVAEVGDMRTLFYANTWTAIKDHLWTGTGLGTFVIVYPFYEPLDQIISRYINHAHNDYLELLLELGIVFIPLLLIFLWLLFRALFGTSFQQAAALSLLSILVHSFVDYPLRTMSIAILFAFFSAIIATRTSKSTITNTDGRQATEADGVFMGDPRQHVAREVQLIRR